MGPGWERVIPTGPSSQAWQKNSTQTVDELVEAEHRLARKCGTLVTLDAGLGFQHHCKQFPTLST